MGMKYGKLLVEKKEYEKVKNILVIGGELNDIGQKNAIKKLANELKLAELKKDADMPEVVVRLNSTVLFKMPDMQVRKFKLVSPSESDVSQNRLSLLSPMGLALFGYAKGDDIEWQFPAGLSNITIVEVEQEKSKSYDPV
jgi:regulator of nucleoside diphosphate kinase